MHIYNHKQAKLIEKIRNSTGQTLQIDPEIFEKEKRKLLKTDTFKNATNEDILNYIHSKMLKEATKKVEKPDFGHRNYILPSYHSKTHFKAAQAIQMQTVNSLKGSERYFRGEFKLASDNNI